MLHLGKVFEWNADDVAGARVEVRHQIFDAHMKRTSQGKRLM